MLTCSSNCSSAVVISLNPEGEWESGNGSFSFLRTLGEWEWVWEWVWAIRKNFVRKRKFFLESLASRRGSLRQKITIFLGVQVSRK